MDQSDARHLCLPVIDCLQFDGEMRALIERATRPSDAELAAHVIARDTPRGQAVTPERARAEAARVRAAVEASTGPATLDDLQRQAHTWARASASMRIVLTQWSDLRATHPQQTVDELAARSWHEIPPPERVELASAVRVLGRMLAGMQPIAAVRG